MEDEKKYFVMRWCCSSGNCLDCFHLPLGQRVRVSQMGPKPIDLNLAERVHRGFSYYEPTIELADGTVVRK